jgi:acetolactate synthase-1/2/3 large subunit
LKIHSDCKIFIEKLNNLKDLSSKKSGWLNWCLEIKEKYPNIEIENTSDNGIEPYNFMNKLSKELSENEIVITANGSAFVVYFQAGEVKKNQRYIWNSGDASMGYDLPAAIGACIASGGKRIVCIAGDGSIMMNLQELQTIKHYNLPIKIFLLNNSGYVSIRQTQNAFFDGRKTASCPQSGVSIPSFTDVAKAFGIKAMKIEKENEIKTGIIKALEADEAVLCEVMLKADYGFIPKLASKCLEDGTMISSSLEDMYPFWIKKRLKKS